MATPLENIPPLAERREKLEALCYHDTVVARQVTDTMVKIGQEFEEPLCTVVPCTNHRVKGPIGFIKAANGTYRLVTFVFREDIIQLKGTRGGDTELDVFQPFVKLMELDLKIHTVAYGYRGSMIMQTGFEEFTLQIEAQPIARMHFTRFAPAGSFKTTCRGLLFYITVPGSERPLEFEEFAQSITPSFVAISWKEERNRREELRRTG